MIIKFIIDHLPPIILRQVFFFASLANRFFDFTMESILGHARKAIIDFDAFWLLVSLTQECRLCVLEVIAGCLGFYFEIKELRSGNTYITATISNS